MRKKTFWALAVCVMLLLSMVACVSATPAVTAGPTNTPGPTSTPVPTDTPVPTPTPIFDVPVPVELPIWKNLKLSSVVDLGDTSRMHTYSVTVMREPLFWDGSRDLKYKSLMLDLNDGLGQITLMDIHAGFSVVYLYADREHRDSGIATGAAAFDDTNTLIAEAIMKKSASVTGYEILEVHYNDRGEPVFWCISFVTQRLGEKTKELETHGEKENDYFFLWPVGTH